MRMGKCLLKDANWVSHARRQITRDGGAVSIPFSSLLDWRPLLGGCVFCRAKVG